MVSIWLFVLLLAILYDHMSHDYVCWPIWSFCSRLSCFMFFHVFMFYRLFVSLCFFQWHFIDLFSCMAASLFNKLTYLLTYLTLDTPLLRSTFIKDFADLSCNETTDETTDALLLFYFATAPAIWLRHHPLRGVDSVRLHILLTGTRPQCGSWSVAGHFHRKVIGRDSICAS